MKSGFFQGPTLTKRLNANVLECTLDAYVTSDWYSFYQLTKPYGAIWVKKKTQTGTTTSGRVYVSFYQEGFLGTRFWTHCHLFVGPFRKTCSNRQALRHLMNFSVHCVAMIPAPQLCSSFGFHNTLHQHIEAMPLKTPRTSYRAEQDGPFSF